MRSLMDPVGELLREVAANVVMPVFGQLEANPEEKSPGEWVTEADRAAEEMLSPALAALIPGSVVVGEEAAHANPKILQRLKTSSDVWLLDPLDGTANFAAGVAPFSMMVALLREGETVAAWMLDPLANRLVSAEKGSGAWDEGRRIQLEVGTHALGALRGAVLRRFLPEPIARHISAAQNQFEILTAGTRCAGADYPKIAKGETDFTLYWRTLPWDHAPGVLFLNEAGGKVLRLDGTAYIPAEHDRPGLLAAASPHIWKEVRRTLLPSDIAGELPGPKPGAHQE